MVVRPAREGYGFPGTIPNSYFTAGAEHVEQGLVSILVAGKDPAIDIETEGLGLASYRVKCITISDGTHCVLLDPRDPNQARLSKWFTDKASSLTFHNSAFDAAPLCLNDYMVKSAVWKVWDTLIWARLEAPDTYVKKSLEACAVRYLGLEKGAGIDVAFKSLGMTKSEGFKQVDISSPAYQYGAMEDAVITARLKDVIRSRAKDRLTAGHPFTSHIAPDVEYLLDREQIINRMFLAKSVDGLAVDSEYLDNYQAKNGAVILDLGRELKENGIRPGVGQDLVNKLEDLGKLPKTWKRTKTGLLSSTKGDLDKLKHPLALKHVQYKELVKVRDDYLVKIQELASFDGRLHPSVNVLGASATGRMSYGTPPLQQFPEDARGIIMSDTSFSSTDWAQIEPVVMANVAGDVDALSTYEAGGPKLYARISEMAGLPEKKAKVTVLGTMYGIGFKKLADQMGITQEEAKDLREQVFRPLPKSKRLLRDLAQAGDDYGKMITISGRVLDVPMFEGHYAGYKASNYFVQGSAYDLAAEAMIAVHKAGLSETVHLVMHDELIHDTAVDQEIREIMETPPECLIRWAGRVPVLRTDQEILGRNWVKPE